MIIVLVGWNTMQWVGRNVADVFYRKFLTRPTPPVIEKTKYSQGYAGHVLLPLGLSLIVMFNILSFIFYICKSNFIFLLDIYILWKDNKPLRLWLVLQGLDITVFIIDSYWDWIWTSRNITWIYRDGSNQFMSKYLCRWTPAVFMPGIVLSTTVEISEMKIMIPTSLICPICCLLLQNVHIVQLVVLLS